MVSAAPNPYKVRRHALSKSTFRAAMQAAADDDEATLVAEIGELDDPLGRR